MSAAAVWRDGASTSAQRAVWVALLAIVLVLSLRGWGAFQVGVAQDDAAYVVLARSLAAGPAYGMINGPGPPLPPKYPFGFPLLLAPIVGLFPGDLLAPTVVPLAATLLNVSLLFWGWRWLSPITSRWWGLAIGALYGLSPMVILQTRTMLSEPAFTALALSALVVTEICVCRGGAADWRCVGLGVLLACALFTRAVGVALVGAVVYRMLSAGGARGARMLCGVLIGGVGLLAAVTGLTGVALKQLPPWEHLNELQAGRPSITGGRSDVAPRIEQALRVSAGYAFQDVRSVLLPGGGERERAFAERLGAAGLSTVIGVAVAVLVAAGVWQAFRTRALSEGVLAFEMLYGAVLVLWPWHLPRYLYPIQPFLSFQLLLGVAALGAVAAGGAPGGVLGRTRWQRLSVALAWAALVLLAAWRSCAVEDTRVFLRDLSVGACWLAANSPGDAVVLTKYAPPVYLYAERRSVELPAVGSAAELEDVVDKQGVDYLLLGPELRWRSDRVLAYDEHTERVLLPAAGELVARGRLALVYESPARDLVRVYRVERHGPSSADEGGR